MSGLKNMSANGLQNRKGVVLLSLRTVRGLSKSRTDIFIATNTAIPEDGSISVVSHGSQNTKGIASLLVHSSNYFRMRTVNNLKISAQGAPISTLTERNTVPIKTAVVTTTPATAELSAILRDFCDVRNRLDAFYESANGKTFKEFSHDYCSADNNLGEAFGHLFDVLGYYLHNDFAKTLQS